MAKQIKLIRVVIRGEGIADDTDTIGGVVFKREGSGTPAIYFTAQKSRWWHRLNRPDRNDADLKVTTATLPLFKSFGVEFCGDKVNQMVASAGRQETVAGAVSQIKPLLKYFQENFSVA